MRDGVIGLADGRSVGFADLGSTDLGSTDLGSTDLGRTDATAVLWCHGGPGSRLEPAHLTAEADRAGLRLVGVDRPGYGLSTPDPGRTIAGWVPEALAVADHLGIEQFATVGVSTGGAYALALAALAPDRVLGVVACCSMTDMSWQPARATMSPAHALAIWDAPDRDAALAAAVESHGENGAKMLGGGMGPALAPSDLALFRDPAWAAAKAAEWPEMFSHGLEGLTDDRLADGPGWVTFDVTTIGCPVTVLHGGADRMVDVMQARHTVDLVPTARLEIHDDLGHFSIETRVIGAVTTTLARTTRAG